MELNTGSVFVSRYRAESLIVSESDERLARGRDEQTDETVVLHELPLDHQRPFEHLREVSHAHLARVLEILTLDNSVLVISEFVDGQAFSDHVAEELRAHRVPVDAVRSVLRIADVLSTLHEHGAAHGYLNPSSVVALPDDRPGPVLGFHGHREAAFVSPKRRQVGSPPSEADDNWAVAALLYYALLGSPPPEGGVHSAAELAAKGIEHTELVAVLLDGLNADAAARSGSVRTLKRQLAHWFVEHASEESLPPSETTEPPPFPAPAQPKMAAEAEKHDAAASSAEAPGTRRRMMPILAGAGVLIGLGVAWLYSRETEPIPPPAPAPVAAAAPAAEKPAIDLSEVAVTGDEDVLMGDKTATCVAGYLPKGTFGAAPDLSWLCEETDPKKGGTRLRAAVIQSAPKGGGVTESMKLFAKMGWYEQAAFAVVRAACCTDPPALEVPGPGPDCQPMGEVLENLGQAVVEMRDHEELLQKYTSTVHCEVEAGRGHLFGSSRRPSGEEDAAFRELIRPLEAQ